LVHLAVLHLLPLQPCDLVLNPFNLLKGLLISSQQVNADRSILVRLDRLKVDLMVEFNLLIKESS
jgi:hypothetical protein